MLTTDDPDELRMELQLEKRDPAVAIAAVTECEVHLRYELPKIKWTLRFIALILLLILWRLW